MFPERASWRNNPTEVTFPILILSLEYIHPGEAICWLGATKIVVLVDSLRGNPIQNPHRLGSNCMFAFSFCDKTNCALPAWISGGILARGYSKTKHSKGRVKRKTQPTGSPPVQPKTQATVWLTSCWSKNVTVWCVSLVKVCRDSRSNSWMSAPGSGSDPCVGASGCDSGLIETRDH